MSLTLGAPALEVLSRSKARGPQSERMLAFIQPFRDQPGPSGLHARQLGKCQGEARLLASKKERAGTSRRAGATGVEP
jgi:hypothetical protein